jgi:hypothetical protein
VQVAELSACLQGLAPSDRQRYYMAMMGGRRRDRAWLPQHLLLLYDVLPPGLP